MEICYLYTIQIITTYKNKAPLQKRGRYIILKYIIQQYVSFVTKYAK